MAKKVRYQVLKPCFVNGSLVDPKGAKDVFVLADEGLEGAALKLADPERKTRARPPKAPEAGDAGTGGDAGDQGNGGDGGDPFAGDPVA